MSGPAEVFSMAEYLADEMRERGWKTSDVAARMGNERGYDMDAFIFEMILAGASNEATIDDETFAGMARAFEVSEQLLRNLDASWRQFPDRRSRFEAPDEMFNAGAFPGYSLKEGPVIEQIYATKQEAFDAGKAVGRLDLDDHAKKRIADLEAELQRHQRGEDTGYQLTLAELTIAEKRVEALEAALRELAGDDIYNRNGSDWHDVGAMSRGVREFAKSKL